MGTMVKLQHLGDAAIYSLMGAILFIFLFWLIDRVTPGSLWKEILEEKNSALAILMGCAAIALGIIIAASIAG